MVYHLCHVLMSARHIFAIDKITPLCVRYYREAERSRKEIAEVGLEAGSTWTQTRYLDKR